MRREGNVKELYAKDLFKEVKSHKFFFAFMDLTPDED
jgi:hypothetical protein